MTEFTPEEIKFAFESFMAKSITLVNEYYTKEYPLIDWQPKLEALSGRAYWKILKGTDVPEAWTVWGFVRKSDGAIFMAASWKSPRTKGPSAIRGYVTDMSNGMDSVTAYGVRYAQRP